MPAPGVLQTCCIAEAEILRCAQDDNKSAHDDNKSTHDDNEGDDNKSAHDDDTSGKQ